MVLGDEPWAWAHILPLSHTLNPHVLSLGFLQLPVIGKF